MTRINLGALSQWRPMAIAELYFFPTQPGGYRNVEFDLMTDGPATVRAFTEDESWIIAHGSGLMELRFTVAQDTSVAVHCEPETEVFLRTYTTTQVVEETGEVSFTQIEPRQARVSSEVERMMQIMKLNQRLREKQLQEQITALQQARQPEAVKPPTLQERAKKKAPAVAPDPDNGVGNIDDEVTE